MATLGKPPITTPRQLDLKQLAAVVGNIRQRFEALEAILNATSLQAGQSSVLAGQSNATISNLQRQISALQSTVDDLGAGSDLETLRADTSIDIFAAVYPSTDGGVSQVSPGDPVAIYAVSGIATAAAVAGSSVTIRKRGVLQVSGAVYEPGGPVYVGLDGLTQVPDYLNVAIPIGVAVSADEVDINPGWPALQYPGVYSGYEFFLPATWGLVRDAVNLAADFNAASNGLVVRVGVDDITTRSIASGTGITVTNGDGVAGNPTIVVNLTFSPTWTGNHTFTPVSGNTLFSAGNVGIGVTPASTAKLDVGGGSNARIQFIPISSGIQVLARNSVDSAATVLAFIGAAVTFNSDTAEVFRSTADNRFVVGSTTAGGPNKVRIVSGTDAWLRMEANAASSSYMQLRRGDTAADLGYIGSDGGGAISVGTGSRLVVRGENAVVLAVGNSEKIEVATNSTSVKHGLLATIETSPTQITSNQNDYAGLASTTFQLRLTSDAARDITGMTGGVQGRVVFVTNAGTNNITLKNQDAASAAANRFGFGADVVLVPDASALLRYDGTSSRWRAV
jgi:hypothetical protein